MCLICATAVAGTVATAASLKVLKRNKFKPYLYRVYIGPSVWTGRHIGYVYAKSVIGIYWKSLLAMRHLPQGTPHHIEHRNNAGDWENW